MLTAEQLTSLGGMYTSLSGTIVDLVVQVLPIAIPMVAIGFFISFIRGFLWAR